MNHRLNVCSQAALRHPGPKKQVISVVLRNTVLPPKKERILSRLLYSPNSGRNRQNHLVTGLPFGWSAKLRGRNPKEPWRGRSNLRCDMASVSTQRLLRVLLESDLLGATANKEQCRTWMTDFPSPKLNGCLGDFGTSMSWKGN